MLILVGIAWSRPALAVQPANGPLYTVDVRGAVTSVTIGYMRRALNLAEASNASALIIRLQSSGGVLSAMRPFAGELAKARVPVVVFVAPSGVQSGAAGALFLSAAHVSAMAPGTSFGSPAPLAEVDAALTDQTRDLVLDSVTNQLRAWNAAHGRNTDWIDRAVRDGYVLTNEQAIALQPPAVDLVAADQEELLTLLDGRVVKLADGSSVQLSTLGRAPTPVAPSLWERLRLMLAEPTIAFLLLVMGAFAIYLEIAAPGTTIFAGVGVVLLAAAAAGLLVLPIRWWSLLLILLALGLIGVEFYTPTHGALAVTGLAVLVVGALTLIDPAQAPDTAIALWVVALVVLGLGSFAALGIWLALRNRARPVTTGQEAIVGKVAEVRRRLEPDGMVFVEGALWQAVSEDGTVEAGDWVRVVAVHELRLIVRRLDGEAAEA
ncbi:MAG TPA: NfeD family protein [Roseiflexaceae bacterium]|nr:NfeD family protein [Roseiflexaceae bacterium]